MNTLLSKSPFLGIAALLIVGISCNQQEKEVPTPSVTITDSIAADYESVTIQCSVSGNVTADRLIIEYAKDQSLSAATKKTAEKSGSGFSITINGLEIETTYYYRYTVENKINSIHDEKVRQFKTLDYTVPQVTTVGVKDITGQSATVEGRVDFTCGKPILEQGFYWGTDKAALSEEKVTSDIFTLPLDNLAFGSKYYYQAYAKSEIGTGKGEILDFTTLSGVPVLETLPVTSITTQSATLNGEIKSDGGSVITERGFCYSETQGPTIDATKIEIEGALGQITKEITGLKPATKYYARVYAINAKGTHYGNEVAFSSNRIPVISITLDQTSLTLSKGESKTLTAAVKPDDATDKTVTWSTSNSSVANVENGVVTAIGGGTASITARAGDLIAVCSVTVTVPVESVTLDKTSIELYVGEKATLTAVIMPSDATNRSLTWSSYDSSIASVQQYSNYGYVEAKKVGTTQITVITLDGAKSANCTVKVIDINISNYLTFSSEGNTSLSLENYSGNAPVLYYSKDASNWSRWDYSALSFSKDSPLYIYGDNPNGFSKSFDSYSKFKASGSKFNCSGDIMSLIKGNQTITVIPSEYCFRYLFAECKLITAGPLLPATTLTQGCYQSLYRNCVSLEIAPSLPAMKMVDTCYNSMFYGCTSLINAPDLPATELGYACYCAIFSGCTNLKTPPSSLPAMKMHQYCYEEMFQNCVNLESAPELPATSLYSFCYARMFENCAKINYIKCMATDFSNQGCYEWVRGVSSTGTFVKNATMESWPRGDSGIPVNWIVSDASD